jgi:hypothetical protein
MITDNETTLCEHCHRRPAVERCRGLHSGDKLDLCGRCAARWFDAADDEEEVEDTPARQD